MVAVHSGRDRPVFGGGLADAAAGVGGRGVKTSPHSHAPLGGRGEYATSNVSFLIGTKVQDWDTCVEVSHQVGGDHLRNREWVLRARES